MKATMSIKKIIIGSLCMLGLMVTVYAQTGTFGNEPADSPETRVGQGFSFPKERDQIELNYFGQPPLIPHSIETYQVNRNINTCLNCHGISTYKIAQATRINSSHIKNNKLYMKHYFCDGCHIEQTDSTPLVQNDFKPAP